MNLRNRKHNKKKLKEKGKQEQIDYNKSLRRDCNKKETNLKEMQRDKELKWNSREKN